MQISKFADNPADRIARATRVRIVRMCAEAAPWRCRRSLIADALVVHSQGSTARQLRIRRKRHRPNRLSPASDHRRGSGDVRHFREWRETGEHSRRQRSSGSGNGHATSPALHMVTHLRGDIV